MEKGIEITGKEQESSRCIFAVVSDFFHHIIPSHFAYTLPVALVIVKVLKWNLQTS